MKVLYCTCVSICAFFAGAAESSAALQYWELRNHPGASIGPPGYGLRLDGLGGFDDVTFNFDSGFVSLTYDDVAETIHIQGNVLGGSDVGTSYSPQTSFLIDFTYSSKIREIDRPRRNKYGFKVRKRGIGTGTITPLDDFGTLTGGVPVELEAKASGAYSFKFNNFDDYRLGGNGIPGVDTFVGWGWLNHSGQPHINESDWLFIAERVPNLTVPEPTSLALWSMFGISAGAFQWRKNRMRANKIVC